MENGFFLYILRRKKQTFISIIILFLILSAVLTFIQPFKYSAKSKLLVVQKFPSETDAYVMSRSNEYLSTVLAKVIDSNSFFDDVMNTEFDINRSYFSGDSTEQMKLWENTISAQPIADTGIINIAVYHKDKYQAEEISKAINSVMIAKHTNYHGAGDKVEIKLIDGPAVSTMPVKPNIALNLAAGLLAGCLFAMIYIYLFPEEHFNVGFSSQKTKYLNMPSTTIQTRNDMPKNEGININISERVPNYQNKEKIVTAEYDDLDIIGGGNMNNIFGPKNPHQ